MLLRDQGNLAGAGTALSASQAIFETLGDTLWKARVLFSKAMLDELRGEDPEPAMREARAICRRQGITSGETIASALREW